jgi:hypothetical protein
MERNSWGFSLFSDDVRAEMGGKLSVMGIYQTDMVFPHNTEIPFLFPKFCILIKYYEIQDAFTDDIFIRVFFPGDAKDTPSVVLPFPRATLGNAANPYPLEDDQVRIFNLTFPLMLSPFPIKQEGFLKVRVVCGAITTNLGSLMIRKARADENIQLPNLPPPPQLAV